MAELIFKYGTMSSGKSLQLLTFAHQLKHNNIKYQLLKPSIDIRTEDTIKSRIGVEEPCTIIGNNDIIVKRLDKDVKWLLIDESQFLSKNQVDELGFIVDKYNINVICYGLRTDYQTNLFEGSKRLFEIADRFEELISYCSCGSKTSVNSKIDNNGTIDISDESGQIDIGGDEKYKALCRKCYHDKILETVEYAVEI